MLGSVELRGSSDVVTLTPWLRTLGGRKMRKSRAGFAQGEKGLNFAVTSVINLVIMLGEDALAGAAWYRG